MIEHICRLPLRQTIGTCEAVTKVYERLDSLATFLFEVIATFQPIHRIADAQP